MADDKCVICNRRLPEETPKTYSDHEVPDLIKKVGGLWTGPKHQHELQCEVAAGLHRHDPWKFPGAQPVSFAASHFEELRKEDYYVCEKTDGLRVLMFMSYRRIEVLNPEPGQPPWQEWPVCYLIDRRNNYYAVDGLRFPHQDNKPGNYQKFHKETILDGELVEDKLPDGRKSIKFLAFDLLIIDQKDLRERSLDKRLAYLKDFVLKPYSDMIASRSDIRDQQPFLFEDKKTHFSYALQAMFYDVIPKVKELHGNDGLIFTCRSTSYHSGTDDHILKWKPPNENTIDFLMRIKWSTTAPDPADSDQTPQEDYYSIPEQFGLYIFHGQGNYAYIDDLHVTPDDWEEMKSKNYPLQDAIVECFMEDAPQVNGDHGTNGIRNARRWRFHRLRDDKDEANHVSTYDSVKESIYDNITQEVLLERADDIRAAWKKRHSQPGARPA